MGRNGVLHLDRRRSNLVLQPVQGTLPSFGGSDVEQAMALISSLATLLGLVVFTCIAAALGHKILRLLRLEFSAASEAWLCSVVLGVITLEIGLNLAEVLGAVRIGVFACIAAAAIVGAPEFPVLFREARSAMRSILSGPRAELMPAAAMALVLGIEGLAAMAPLTGADAMHYHFTAPLLVLHEGFKPNYFLSQSFFCGQGHLLILGALAVGCEKLAMGLLFLGGALAACALVCLGREWMSRPLGWLAGLSFLLTPLVFWQISTAGAPDLWMCFYATMGVIVIARSGRNGQIAKAFVAGLCAGAIAGTKYTGCLVAASLLLALLWESRSVYRAAVFVSGAFVSGIWPYARNAIWTGDPFFPFLMRWLAPARINSYTLKAYLAETVAGGAHNLGPVVKFSLFAAYDPLHAGFWQFLGPLVIVFAPLLILTVRNTALWRTTLIVWFASSVGIGATSGMARYALPVFPLALAASFAGVSHLDELNWRIVRRVSLGTIVIYLLIGAGGLMLYQRTALSAGVGLVSREKYLQERAPNYEMAEFINGALKDKENDGKALVFFRHLYYLQVPFVYGDPAASWAIDPERFQTPDAWRELFRRENIRWVVRSPMYPAAIAQPLRQLEEAGELAPCAQGEVDDFDGMRLLGSRKVVPVALLCVKD